ncbi:hypothetical protein [uncultured Chryseobacterium sp.]|uniref:hypothetical protein n=1 Tax=uncultured Chryseobacterium sp. TaxID=259322 RepID=UPI0025FE5B8B|nr:hypothetical protein [uncultured Chryseobacterium sp.]
MMVILIMIQYFLSILLVFQIATKRADQPSSGFKDILIVLIWLGGAVAIIYFFIKFLISIYRYKE